jgi:hypothetical protein
MCLSPVTSQFGREYALSIYHNTVNEQVNYSQKLDYFSTVLTDVPREISKNQLFSLDSMPVILILVLCWRWPWIFLTRFLAL